MAVSARGRANQCLYLARILLAAWERDLAGENIPAATLAQAYLPAIQAQLRASYGWFLFDVTRQEPLPPEPPASCADLPPRPEGKAIPGEIRECAQLERDGWLAAMLAAEPAGGGPAARSPDNLAAEVQSTGPAQVSAWAAALQDLFDRLGESLDEW